MSQDRRRTSDMVRLSNMKPEEIVKDPVQYELEWVRVLLDEAWKMYLKYGGEIADEEVSEQYEIDEDEEEKLVGKTVKTKTRNDPKIAMSLFDRITRLQDKHRELMGVKSGDARDIAKEKTESIPSNGFNPQEAWNK